MNREIRKVLVGITGLFLVLMIGCTVYLGKSMKKAEDVNGLVLLNEIEQLTMEEEGENPAQSEIDALRDQLQKKSAEGQRTDIRWIAGTYLGATVLYLIAVWTYLYFKILRPFYTLESYAGRVAKGDMDIALEYERTNFFGAFTWAFDHMREEIRHARKNEADAIRENKTIIATLSHDIKTPIASIRAYAEGLEAGLDADYEQRERYVSVILKKCDEVTRLTNDLMLHSLSELESLAIKAEKINIGKVLEETLRDLEYPYVTLLHSIPEAVLLADEKRMEQVLENLLNNAGKYAPETEITVWAEIDEEASRYEIHVRDHGQGIPPEDMPFICEKFYRGRNAGDAPGSGLGLYIVNYIMERMHGGMALHNYTDGLEVVLWLPADGEI